MKKTAIALAIASIALPTMASAQDDYVNEEENTQKSAAHKAGFRVEGRAFYENITDPEEDIGIVYEFGNGVGAGVEFGADFAVSDTVVLGPYVTYDFSSMENCEDGACLSTPTYWAVGLHAGIVTGSKGMVFAKLGYGEQEVTLEGTFIDPVDGPILVDETESGGGYNFALGYEHGFGGPLYGRVEVGVSESYDIYGFDLQRGFVGLGLGARF